MRRVKLIHKLYFLKKDNLGTALVRILRETELVGYVYVHVCVCVFVYLCMYAFIYYEEHNMHL